MVDPNSRNQPFCSVEWDAVNGGEYFRIFRADCGQVVDIEKTTVVDFVDATRQKLRR